MLHCKWKSERCAPGAPRFTPRVQVQSKSEPEPQSRLRFEAGPAYATWTWGAIQVHTRFSRFLHQTMDSLHQSTQTISWNYLFILVTLWARGSYFGTKHLEQTILSYTHFIKNSPSQPRQHYIHVHRWQAMKIYCMSQQVDIFWKDQDMNSNFKIVSKDVL